VYESIFLSTFDNIEILELEFLLTSYYEYLVDFKRYEIVWSSYKEIEETIQARKQTFALLEE